MTNSRADSDPALAFLRRRRAGRAAALRFLYQADVADAWAPDPPALAAFWEQAAEHDETLDEEEFAAARTFAEALIAGVLEHRDELDARIAAAAANWSLARMAAVDRNILRLAAYEMLKNRDQVPALAALNEAIELAREFGDKDSTRFVNGILDRLLRDSG